MVAVSPVDGSTIADTQAIAIDVTSPLAGFRVIITAEFPSIAVTEVVFDGTTWTPLYRNAITAATPITDGTHFVFLRTAVWPDIRVRITVDVFGADGSFVQSIYQWAVVKVPAVVSSPPDVKAKVENDPLGFGAIRPFRMGSQDLVSSAGEPLVDSNVGQILGTRKGEVRWRPSFGASPDDLRHRRNTQALGEIGRIAIASSLARWEPRARIISVTVQPSVNADKSDLQLSLKYQITGGTGTQTARLEL